MSKAPHRWSERGFRGICVHKLWTKIRFKLWLVCIHIPQSRYTQFGPNSASPAEYLHINRYHDTEWAPGQQPRMPFSFEIKEIHGAYPCRWGLRPPRQTMERRPWRRRPWRRRREGRVPWTYCTEVLYYTDDWSDICRRSGPLLWSSWPRLDLQRRCRLRVTSWRISHPVSPYLLQSIHEYAIYNRSVHHCFWVLYIVRVTVWSR